MTKGVVNDDHENNDEKSETLKSEFIKKYIAYAKHRMEGQIKLTDEANDIIKQYYIELRESNVDRFIMHQ